MPRDSFAFKQLANGENSWIRIESKVQQNSPREPRKEATGKVLGDQNLEIEGETQKAAGKVQNALGGLKDAVRGK